MKQDSRVVLTNDTRIRAIEKEFHGPFSPLQRVQVGSKGFVFATPSGSLDDYVVVKWNGLRSPLIVRRSNIAVDEQG